MGGGYCQSLNHFSLLLELSLQLARKKYDGINVVAQRQYLNLCGYGNQCTQITISVATELSQCNVIPNDRGTRLSPPEIVCNINSMKEGIYAW